MLSVLPSLKDANQVSARHLRSARAALSDAGFLLRENVVALQGIEGVTPSAVSAIESIGHRVAVVNSIDGLRSEEYSLRVSEKAWRARDSNQPFVFYCVSGDVRLRLLRCENPFRSKLAVVNLVRSLNSFGCWFHFLSFSHSLLLCPSCLTPSTTGFLPSFGLCSSVFVSCRVRSLALLTFILAVARNTVS